MSVYAMNETLSNESIALIRSYLRFPEHQPITAFDPISNDQGRFLRELLKDRPESYLYGAIANIYSHREAAKFYTRVCRANFDEPAKITPDVFSLAVVDVPIHDRVYNHLLMDFDPFTKPDFEAEARRDLADEIAQQLDLGDEGLTPEEVEQRKEEMKKKLADTAKQKAIAFVKAVNAREAEINDFRKDKFLMSMVRDKLAPGGVLIVITPKELIDTEITHHLANSFENITIVRLPDDEYHEKRKVVIIAKKKARNERDNSLALALVQNRYKKYKDFDVLGDQSQVLDGRKQLSVPSKSPDDILNFRIGPVTAEEVMSGMNKSHAISNFFKNHAPSLINETPKPPSMLHKGHIALLLSSGLLNGYIGEGANKHLVKGTVIKQVEERREVDPSTEQNLVLEREYFNISVTYLNRNGEFKELL